MFDAMTLKYHQTIPQRMTRWLQTFNQFNVIWAKKYRKYYFLIWGGILKKLHKKSRGRRFPLGQIFRNPHPSSRLFFFYITTFRVKFMKNDKCKIVKVIQQKMLWTSLSISKKLHEIWPAFLLSNWLPILTVPFFMNHNMNHIMVFSSP